MYMMSSHSRCLIIVFVLFSYPGPTGPQLLSILLIALLKYFPPVFCPSCHRARRFSVCTRRENLSYMCPYMGSVSLSLVSEVEETDRGESWVAGAFCEVQRRTQYFFPFHRAIKLLGMCFQLSHCSPSYSPDRQRPLALGDETIAKQGGCWPCLCMFLWP